MSYQQQQFHMGSTSGRSRAVEFGRTHVVRPRGQHQATVVWLHGMGDNGSSWSQVLEALSIPNIKWICPTAPSRPVKMLGGFRCTACKQLTTCLMIGLCYRTKGFDVEEMSEDTMEDIDGLDASAAHIANLLSSEPADVKVGIGGFSMGGAIALYSATCAILGRYGNGNIPYTINPSAIVSLSGWLPCGSRNLRGKIQGSHEAARRAAWLPILVTHGTSDDQVPYSYGEKSARWLCNAGFGRLTFKRYDGIGHYTIPKEMEEVKNWIAACFGQG
ncbi:Acyl-protein thioesterase 2 [Linum perenne]